MRAGRSGFLGVHGFLGVLGCAVFGSTRALAIWAAAAIALPALTAVPVLAAEKDLSNKGEVIVREHCARCHAIGRSGDSPKAEAPPFRVLSQSYPVDSLAESLAEGIMSGHPEMPVFVFTPHDVDAIITYLQSIQVPADGSPSDADPSDTAPSDTAPSVPDAPGTLDSTG